MDDEPLARNCEITEGIQRLFKGPLVMNPLQIQTNLFPRVLHLRIVVEITGRSVFLTHP